MNSGQCPELPLPHKCSTQQEIVHVKWVLAYWIYSVWIRWGLAPRLTMKEAGHDRKSTLFCLQLIEDGRQDYWLICSDNCFKHFRWHVFGNESSPPWMFVFSWFCSSCMIEISSTTPRTCCEFPGQWPALFTHGLTNVIWPHAPQTTSALSDHKICLTPFRSVFSTVHLWFTYLRWDKVPVRQCDRALALACSLKWLL